MIYILTLALLGLCLALAIGAGTHELRRLSSELAIEKSRHLQASALHKANEEGVSAQRSFVANTLETSMSQLLSSADEHLSVYDSETMQLSSLSQATLLLKSVQRELNDLTNPVPKSELAIYGLESCLSKLVERMNCPQLSIFFTSNLGELRFSKFQEKYLFQACSELIQNTLKHSFASQCYVILSEDNGELRLKVRDNGFNSLAAGPPVQGFGLTRLKQKCDRFDGSFKFSLSKYGAETVVSLPLNRTAVLAIA